jgi:hypothetical protein
MRDALPVSLRAGFPAFFRLLNDYIKIKELHDGIEG